MKIAIMQPTYLPWAGYFNLIARADCFVILDDVQFAARSWQQRNRILLNGESHMLSIPVLVKGRAEQLIQDATTDETQKWRLKHIATVRRAYCRHPHGTAASDLVESVLQREITSLADINVELIAACCRNLGIDGGFPRSSQLNVGGRKSAHLLEICRHFGADTYLSAAGSREYIEQEGLLSAANMRVQYQNFVATPYPQLGSAEFVANMSIVDVVANVGFDGARAYVESHEF
jgi:hypothetical protein